MPAAFMAIGLWQVEPMGFTPNIVRPAATLLFRPLNIAAEVPLPRHAACLRSVSLCHGFEDGSRRLWPFATGAELRCFWPPNEVRPCIFCCCSLLPNCLPGKYCQPVRVKWGRKTRCWRFCRELATSADVPRRASCSRRDRQMPKIYRLAARDCCLAPILLDQLCLHELLSSCGENEPYFQLSMPCLRPIITLERQHERESPGLGLEKFAALGGSSQPFAAGRTR